MVRIRLQPHGSAAYESRVQSQKQNIRKHALLYFQPQKKGLIAREEGDRASCLKDVLKTPFFLEFASNGVANRDNDHMLLEHYISQFTAGEMMLFDHDIVPFCADARENNPRTGIVRHKLSACAPEGDSVRMVHCNLTLSAGSDCLLWSFRRCFMFPNVRVTSERSGRFRWSVNLLPRNAAFHEFLLGTIKGGVQLQVQGPIPRAFMLYRKWNERSTGGVSHVPARLPPTIAIGGTRVID